MHQNANKVAKQFKKADKEIETLDGELRQRLGNRAYNIYARWVNSLNPAEEIWSVVGDRCERISELSKQAETDESDEEVQHRIKSYFETVNPGPIAKELKEKCHLNSLAENYHQSVEKLKSSSDIGPIVNRYHIPPKVVNTLIAGCLFPLKPSLNKLGVHANQIKSHSELLEDIASQKGLKRGLGVASSIAGGALLGPLGAFGARFLAKIATDPTSKIDESAEKVEDTFETFRATFVESMDKVETNLLYLITTLYGGLILRVNKDLNTLGKRLVVLDFSSGDVEIGMSFSAQSEFKKWASDALKNLDKLKKNKEWGKLGDLADKSLRVTLSDPLRTQIVFDDNSTSYAIHFARMRATALNKAADMAWSEGRYNEAGKLYSHLIEGSNIACDLENGNYQSSASVYKAGLRLAILATNFKEEISIFPQFIIQTLARFKSENTNASIPGEMLSGSVIQLSLYITEFMQKNGSKPTLFSSAVPGNVNLGDGIKEWKKMKKEPINYNFILNSISKRSLEKFSDTSLIIKDLKKTSQSGNKLSLFTLFFILIILLIVGLGSYFFVEWKFG